MTVTVTMTMTMTVTMTVKVMPRRMIARPQIEKDFFVNVNIDIPAGGLPALKSKKTFLLT